ncbi:MAG: pyrroline-5-carboxylate reductase [Dehalococcoidales bacterium]|nr:pyrroline-5-carboxylate reductase [Dehalococcoidales bacterium]
MKLTIIGGGNMAKAIIKALLESQAISAEEITVSDVNPENLKMLQNSLSVNTVSSNRAAICSADIVILAIKPQNLDELSKDLSRRFKPGQLIISILAGTPLARLITKLQHNEIIRAMPNTPAQIGMGMTIWTASEQVSAKQQRDAQTILSSMGSAMCVSDEGYIDKATAISGSGPAYFFLFMEYMVDSAIKLGFDIETARKLVLQTANGSITYAVSSSQKLSELRRQVTSPGGTTAEAIAYFESNDIKEIINGAIMAAYRKATEMGRH